MSPYCDFTGALGGIDAAHRVLVISGAVTGTESVLAASSIGIAEVSVIGSQLMGTTLGIVTGPPTAAASLTIDGAALYLRKLAIQGNPAIGLEARDGATIRMDGVVVESNRGGGLLIDASAFDIRNSTFTSNGPGNAAGASWGGVRIQGTATLLPRALTNVTITVNKQIGLSCTAAVVGTGVLIGFNTGGVDVSPTCGITSCPAPAPDCGAP